MVEKEAGLALFASLPDRDLRREGIILGEGRLTAARVAARCEPLAALCVPAARGDAESIAAGRCPVIELPEGELAAVAGFPFHRGLMLAARRPALPSLRDAVGGAAGGVPAAACRLVALPAAGDPENLGAIVRTAAALGWDGVVLGPDSCDPFGRRALRCSMGAVLSLPLFAAESHEDLALLRAAGWTLAAAAGAESAEEPAALGGIERLVLVLGNERAGIPAAARECCSRTVAIPQGRGDAEGVDSLNVAAAAAILLWEGRPLLNA